jgi:hypothetical protein
MIIEGIGIGAKRGEKGLCTGLAVKYSRVLVLWVRYSNGEDVSDEGAGVA